MKIAFVSQPIDSVLPPYQNSIGVCTYGSACALAKEHEVVVYGLSSFNSDAERAFRNNVKFRFIRDNALDQALVRLRTRVSRALPLQPISTDPRYYMNYGYSVARELQQEKFDVIHIQHSSQYAPVIRAMNPNAKIVLHLHAEWFTQSKPSQLRRRVAAVDLLTGVSEHVVSAVARLLPNLNVRRTTHYNGIGMSEFQRHKDKAKLAARLDRYIFYAGGISPHKGLHVLMDAFRIVAEKLPNVRLLLSGPAGTYPYEETFDHRDKALRAELAPYYTRSLSPFRKLITPGSSLVPDYVAQLLGRVPSNLTSQVQFLGKIPRDQLIDHFYDSDLFVFPSLFAEGFGLPPLEAMAAGTPVVATRSGALVETVQDGITGLLVEKNNPNDLAQAMLQLLQNRTLSWDMGQAGRVRAQTLFSWEAVTEKMSVTYKNLLANSIQRVSSLEAQQASVQG